MPEVQEALEVLEAPNAPLPELAHHHPYPGECQMQSFHLKAVPEHELAEPAAAEAMVDVHRGSYPQEVVVVLEGDPAVVA